MNELPNYKEYPWLDVRYARNCKAYNDIRGTRLSNGSYLSMMLTEGFGGVMYFIIADQTARGSASYQHYGESLLTIARRAKKNFKVNQEWAKEDK
jgi:hypothetical protein